MSIDQRSVKITQLVFVTLTYPEMFPTARETKRHLEEFRRRLLQLWGQVAGKWKLEPQPGRGAPHYHLLLIMSSHFSLRELLEWAAANWANIVAECGEDWGQVFRVHMGSVGNRPCVEQVRSWNGVAIYSGKYIGKTFELDALSWPAEVLEKWRNPGRFHGMIGDLSRYIRMVHVDLTEAVAAKLTRAVRSLYEHQPSGRWRISEVAIVGAGVKGRRSVWKHGRRCVEFGAVRRIWLPAAVGVAFDEPGYFARPMRRRWKGRNGAGISCFMAAADFERLITWAYGECLNAPRGGAGEDRRLKNLRAVGSPGTPRYADPLSPIGSIFVDRVRSVARLPAGRSVSGAVKDG
jgi:hypothetical protein